MKNLIDSFKIKTMKAKARKYYNLYYSELDKYSCGSNLAEHINPRMGKYANKFNNVMDELSMLDPSCPKTRL